MQVFIKLIVSAAIIAIASEAAKRSVLLAAIIISIPLTSIISIGWVWWESHDTAKVIALSNGIFWMVVPSLVFFMVLSGLLKTGFRFEMAMAFAIAVMAVGYAFYALILRKFGFPL